jgi:hypothetical protein
MPAVDGEQTNEELGRCQTRVNRSGTEVMLRCLKAGATPPCSVFFLENPASGRRNPKIISCDAEYAPFFMQVTPDALSRLAENLPFRDPAELWHAPVDGSQLRESRVVMRLYQPLEHFTRRVVIPDVRLHDWLPR